MKNQRRGRTHQVNPLIAVLLLVLFPPAALLQAQPMGAVRTVDASASVTELGTQVAFDSDSKTEPPDSGSAIATATNFGQIGTGFGFGIGAVSTADFALTSFVGSDSAGTGYGYGPSNPDPTLPDLVVRSEVDSTASFDAGVSANHRYNFLLRSMRLTAATADSVYDLDNPFSATVGAQISFQGDIIYSYSANLRASGSERQFNLSTFSTSPADFPVFATDASDDPNNGFHSFSAPDLMVSLNLGQIGQGTRFSVDYFAFTEALTPGFLLPEQVTSAAFGDPANLEFLDITMRTFDPRRVSLNEDPTSPNFSFTVATVPEPTVMGMSLGALALLLCRRRQRNTRVRITS